MTIKFTIVLDYGTCYLFYLISSKSRPFFPRYESEKKSSVADPGCLSRIPDLKFSISDPGLNRFRILIHTIEIKYF